MSDQTIDVNERLIMERVLELLRDLTERRGQPGPWMERVISLQVAARMAMHGADQQSVELVRNWTDLLVTKYEKKGLA